jgi:hypothetical protein
MAGTDSKSAFFRNDTNYDCACTTEGITFKVPALDRAGVGFYGDELAFSYVGGSPKRSRVFRIKWDYASNQLLYQCGSDPFLPVCHERGGAKATLEAVDGIYTFMLTMDDGGIAIVGIDDMHPGHTPLKPVNKKPKKKHHDDDDHGRDHDDDDDDDDDDDKPKKPKKPKKDK